MLYHKITELIGNTPLLEIDPKVHGLKNVNLYAKLEYYNPFGSVKDRMAWNVLEDEIDQIRQDDQTILEMSSGNTARALQAIASINGVRFKTITNRIKVEEVKDILKVQGADIQELPGKSDCHDPNDPNDPLVYINKEIKDRSGKVYFTSQYDNEKNAEAHYKNTGSEILADLQKPVDYLFGGVGTSGSTTGTSQRLSEENSALKTFGVVAAKDDYIPGIRNRDEVMEVGLFDPSFYTDILEVDSQKAVKAELNLVRQAGVLCGPTSGATYAVITDYFTENVPERQVNVVFIVCDRLEWYMSYLKDRAPEIFGLNQKTQPVLSLSEDELAEVKEIAAKEAWDLLEKGEAMAIDIRSNLGYRAIHMEHSINVPRDELMEYLRQNSKPFPNKPLIIVCPVGKQSKPIAANLAQLGYEAYSLNGGIQAWQDDELPTGAYV